jgi:hypothetical protein
MNDGQKVRQIEVPAEMLEWLQTEPDILTWVVELVFQIRP